jgi:hypothetical protein
MAVKCFVVEARGVNLIKTLFQHIAKMGFDPGFSD